MRDRITAVTVAVALALTAGCGEDEAPMADGGPSSSLPPVAAALWAIDEPEVPVAPPATPWLPADEDALTRVRAAEPDGFSFADPGAAAQTLYLDPSAEDPATARALLVGRVDISDTDGALPVPEGDAVDVGGVEGTVVEARGLVVVRWPNPDANGECACDQDLFVAGRDVARADVVAAARVAEPLAPLPSLPADAVAGLRSLGTSPAVLGRDLAGRTSSQVVELRRDGVDITVAVVGSDPRLVPHLAFWAPGGATLTPWDRPLVAAQLDDGTVGVATSTRFGLGLDEPLDLDVAVPAVTDALASLAPVTDEAVAAAQRRVLAEVPLEPCDALAPGQVDIAGSVGDTRWTVGISYVDGALNTCEQAADLDGTGTPGGGGGGLRPLDLAAAVELVGGSTSSDGGTGRTHRFAIGHVTAAAATVQVAVPGAPPVDAVLAATGPTPDRRWFAAVVELPALDTEAVTMAVVHDAAGAELGRTTSP
jgi:hypothetical protein